MKHYYQDGSKIVQNWSQFLEIDLHIPTDKEPAGEKNKRNHER